MASHSSPLADAMLEGWQEYQKQLVNTLRPLTAEQLALHASSDLRSAGEIATHLVACRADWFHGVLKEGDDEMAAIEQWEGPDKPLRTAAALAQGLEATWKVMQAAFARWTFADLTEQMVLPWIGPEHPITRSFVVWHVLEHDLHHAGELSYVLGMHGIAVDLPPPPPEQG